ncbi:MAG TPA: nucleoside phosphorylase [Flavitalea sp.]|nr:nucleoside phosphorylase [Flavitalea sp.]
MNRIPESELILNERGAIYHLDLRPDEIAHTVILVGDPGRVPQVSKHFDTIEHQSTHREFITHTGFLGKKRLSVVSTGIGTDNIDIVLNELDALANIDFETRAVKSGLSSLQLLRIGTSGSLQADIPVDAFVASTHGLGIDNLMNFYRYEPNEEDNYLLQSFITQTQLHNQIGYPYIASGAASLLKHFVDGFHHGITVSCPGFYGPQGRILRMSLSQPDLVNRFIQFSSGPHRISNFEMETSALYGMGRVLGHRCLSLNAIIANRVSRQFSSDPANTIERLISSVLAIINDAF